MNLPAALQYMLPPKEQTHVTESYVSSPPALWIVDETGAVWTLGMQMMQARRAGFGEYLFAVLRNAQPTGELASRIERRSGKIRIFTDAGWKRWTGQSFL